MDCTREGYQLSHTDPLVLVPTIRRGLLRVVQEVYESVEKREYSSLTVYFSTFSAWHAAGQSPSVGMYTWMLQTARRYYGFGHYSTDILCGVASVSWDEGYDISKKHLNEKQLRSPDCHKLMLGAGLRVRGVSLGQSVY